MGKKGAPKETIKVKMSYLENLLIVIPMGNGRQSMHPLLAKLKARDLPAKFAYDLARALAKGREEIAPFNEAKVATLQKYAEWDKARGSVVFDDDGAVVWKEEYRGKTDADGQVIEPATGEEKLVEEMKPLREQEVSLGIPPIEPDWDEMPKISEEEMELILPLLA